MITNHLQGIIEQNGGKVLTRKRVVQLVHDDKAVKKVITDDGAEYSADKVIADIHSKLLVELFDDTEGEHFGLQHLQHLQHLQQKKAKDMSHDKPLLNVQKNHSKK